MTDHTLYQMAEVVGVDGFQHHGKWAYFESLLHQVGLSVGSNDHYIHVWVNLADLPEGIWPVHPRHGQIKKNQIESFSPQLFQPQPAGWSTL